MRCCIEKRCTWRRRSERRERASTVCISFERNIVTRKCIGAEFLLLFVSLAPYQHTPDPCVARPSLGLSLSRDGKDQRGEEECLVLLSRPSTLYRKTPSSYLTLPYPPPSYTAPLPSDFDIPILLVRVTVSGRVRVSTASISLSLYLPFSTEQREQTSKQASKQA